MGKLCSGIVVFLLFIIAAGIYKLVLQGSVVESVDGRTSIQLNAVEANHVLTEMRLFLESIQQISQALSEDDMELVAEYARKSGRAAQTAVPETLMAKLPMQFKQSGSDTHVRFDQLALDAEEFGDGTHALKQLSTLMQNCTSCHAAYRIDISNK